MARIYSQNFLRATVGAAGPVLEFPFVGSDVVFIVRDMHHLMPADPVGSSSSVYDNHGTNIWSVTYGPDTSQNEHLDCRIVYGPGDALFWAVLMSPLNPDVATLNVNGYVLSSP